jgi:hypothetical protein
MDYESETIWPQQVLPVVVIGVIAVLVAFFLANSHPAGSGVVQADSTPAINQQSQAGGGVDPKAAVAQAQAQVQPEQSVGRQDLGSATLDLNALSRADSIDESDNVRWSLVRGGSAESKVYSSGSAVDWKALRKLNASGSFSIKAGASWSFNDTFGEGYGYKNASGVLAGGQCALATVFRVAALHADLETKARQHRYPIPGFKLSETVNIWWGSYDLVIKNTTSHPVDLEWKLSPDKVTVTVVG